MGNDRKREIPLSGITLKRDFRSGLNSPVEIRHNLLRAARAYKFSFLSDTLRTPRPCHDRTGRQPETFDSAQIPACLTCPNSVEGEA